MMLTKEKILEIAKQKGMLLTSDLVKKFQVSRQYANSLIAELVKNNQLLKIGSTRKAFYVLPEYAQKHPENFFLYYTKNLRNHNLEEHKIINEIETSFPAINKIPENVKSIFTYAFSEMLNNAIEHSQSKNINIEVLLQDKILSFVVKDFGIGVFRNIQQKRHLKSELEAIQDLLKGKTTTMPKSHSGEGIFFTSKVGNLFILDSFGYQLMINNEIPDVFVEKIKKQTKGTKVIFRLNIDSKMHLNDVFSKYTNLTHESDYGFDKTEIRVKLYTIGGIYISRSQARRILASLDKFKIIVFDFDKVTVVGQAFADEIFRVFQSKYPQIKLETVNMNEGVEFMVKRAINEAKNNF